MLKTVQLQNFRSYSKALFDFSPDTTLVIGPNTSGKTNLTEAISVLSMGKSNRVEKDAQVIAFGHDIARVRGKVRDQDLEVIFTTGNVMGKVSPTRKYLVNGVSKRRVDFVSHLPTVIFSPIDLEIVIASPGIRRRFLNDVLEQVDSEYRSAILTYEKALRQRNALLSKVLETGRRNESQFLFWDRELISAGQLIVAKREKFISFLNAIKKDLFDFTVFYDKSEISKDRLLQYKDAEIGAGVTLVGPHRDDISFSLQNRDVKLFGSRGQQRLVVLQLKLLQLVFMEKTLSELPMLVLDDIFSELDTEHIRLILDMLYKQQTVITTTHLEFVPKHLLAKMHIIELEKGKIG